MGTTRSSSVIFLRVQQQIDASSGPRGADMQIDTHHCQPEAIHMQEARFISSSLTVYYLTQIVNLFLMEILGIVGE